MTHTEESLMSLAREVVKATGWMCSLDTNTLPEIVAAQQALRLAIREVLAERDMHKDEAEAQRLLRQQQRERAEKAEAECERLRKLLSASDEAVRFFARPDSPLKDQP